MQTRRTVLRAGLATAVASALGAACRPECVRTDLVMVPDPEGLIDLAEGLEYVVLDRARDVMSDGYVVPNRPDGMACFARPEGWVLMRNHELIVHEEAVPPGPVLPPQAFDPDVPGSVTRVVVDPETLAVRSSNLVLTGTLKNCGGGPTPAGWLSCEETTDPGHGWTFLCDPDADTVQDPVRIEGYGRFKHEAVAFDPVTGIAILTEDEEDGCLYRFVPADPARPFGPGVLEALAVVGTANAKTTRLGKGEVVDVEWVAVAETDTGDGVRASAKEAGAAVFVRGEGAWWDGTAAVFACTEGGPIEAGQIFRLTPSGQGGVLEVLEVAEDPDAFNSPDNLTVAPGGQLYICEDAECRCLLHQLNPDGTRIPLARTVGVEDELCGVCTSPDGSVVFVNLQTSGVTIAILGLPVA